MCSMQSMCSDRTSKPQPSTPPIPTPAANRLFRYVSTDLYGPLRSGEYLLVIVDQLTRYPEVAILHFTTSHTVDFSCGLYLHLRITVAEAAVKTVMTLPSKTTADSNVDVDAFRAGFLEF